MNVRARACVPSALQNTIFIVRTFSVLLIVNRPVFSEVQIWILRKKRRINSALTADRIFCDGTRAHGESGSEQWCPYYRWGTKGGERERAYGYSFFLFFILKNIVLYIPYYIIVVLRAKFPSARKEPAVRHCDTFYRNSFDVDCNVHRSRKRSISKNFFPAISVA